MLQFLLYIIKLGEANVMAEKKTLFIIGNGFDLALGMQSTFKEFGIYRRKQLENVKLSDWTIIDLALETHTYGGWGKQEQNDNWDWWNFEKFLKDSVLDVIYNQDFLGLISGRGIESKKEDEEKIISAMDEVGIVLSRDEFLLRNTDGLDAELVVNLNKLLAITPDNLDHVSNGYFWQLLLLYRVNKFYTEKSSRLDLFNPYFLHTGDVKTSQTIKMDNISDPEKDLQIPGIFPSFYSLQPVLIRDINIWESEFSKFIAERQGKLLNSGLNYQDASNALMYSVLNETQQNQQVQILNFNYSRPALKESKSLYCGNQLNIHGSIENESLVPEENSGIIIGFDYQVILDYPEFTDFMAPFTKTFRLSELNTVLSKCVPDKKRVRLDYNVDKIVILGHSLSKADDSYFRTIFDTADIYNSDVIIEYWYTDYPGRDQSLSIETESLNRINGLLTRYIKTSRQENKNNLLHKLLLENRLILKEYSIADILAKYGKRKSQ
ncbi:hypothetical protein FC07_GL000312 [Loigolactobacillus bifermentans DSM 20003]|uniref:Uncharacterized protein n=1 Tax=Loigolactobacillus bifermentans DSM 20003 TaxID=1423726 RepID=A0A0R1H1R8_9LACO|nr:hypothetical protein FC07_GL000312 [Loigolactobacillus bifermentans DSM 20003]